jgi:rubredoxin
MQQQEQEQQQEQQQQQRWQQPWTNAGGKLPANYVCRRCGAARQHFIKDCPSNVCSRCGQTGHIATACKVNVAGLLPPVGYVCRRCGAERLHFINNCPSNVCNVCGQTGHIATTCKAPMAQPPSQANPHEVRPEAKLQDGLPPQVVRPALPEPLSSLMPPSLDSVLPPSTRVSQCEEAIIEESR